MNFDVEIGHVDQNTAKIFEITDLDRVFTIPASREDAAEKLAGVSGQHT